jgi:hypothetical protein
MGKRLNIHEPQMFHSPRMKSPLPLFSKGGVKVPLWEREIQGDLDFHGKAPNTGSGDFFLRRFAVSPLGLTGSRFYIINKIC